MFKKMEETQRQNRELLLKISSMQADASEKEKATVPGAPAIIDCSNLPKSEKKSTDKSTKGASLQMSKLAETLVCRNAHASYIIILLYVFGIPSICEKPAYVCAHVQFFLIFIY